MAIVISLWSRNENKQNWAHDVFLHDTLKIIKQRLKMKLAHHFLKQYMTRNLIEKKPEAEIFATKFSNGLKKIKSLCLMMTVFLSCLE